MNAMVVAIPPKVRTWVYLIYALVGIAAGATQVGYATAEISAPAWLKVSIAVYTFLGGAIGYTAATHTPAAVNEVQADEADDIFGGEGGAIGVLAVIGLLLIALGILGLLSIIALSQVISIVLCVIGLVLFVVDYRDVIR